MTEFDSGAFAPDDESELVERLPEIECIDGNPRDVVVSIFLEDVPEYFWIARASETHHPPDERGLGGLWLHTKRAFVALTMLEKSFRAMSTVSPLEANCARAAILLHDAFKYGPPGHEYEEQESDTHPYASGRLHHLGYTDEQHDQRMADRVEQEAVPPVMADCIRTHGGSAAWNGSHSGPTPSNDVELMHHLADLIASNSEHRLPVYQPDRRLDTITPDRLPVVSDGWATEL
jgi:hypothetical protein